MRFAEFLRTTVLVCAGAATALAAVTVAAGAAGAGPGLLAFCAVWWTVAVTVGAWLGRRAEASAPIARLLAGARSATSLPEQRPGTLVLNRLWPLLLAVLGAGALAVVVPQVPAVAAGFAVIWALSWRRQEAAVTAVEDRDGVTFFVEPTSPLRPIRLVRTPGFRRAT